MKISCAIPLIVGFGCLHSTSAHANSSTAANEIGGAPTSAAGADAQVSAAAAASPATGVPEIVVTAQKRSENLQTVPIAVSVASGTQLANQGIENTQDLQFALPGLMTSTTSGFLLPHIRGVGTTALAPGNENSVSLYVDGAYIAASPGDILSLNNVEQVEELKGPQGTLFGRNATGGVILITTAEPDGSRPNQLSVGYGNYNTLSGSIYAATKLADDLTANIALQGLHQGDGYGVNEYNGQDVYKDDVELSARAKVTWKPTGKLSVHVGVDYEHEEGSVVASNQVPFTLAAFGHPVVTNPWNVDEDFQPKERSTSGGAYIRVNYDLGALNFTDTVSYRDLHYFDRFDYDGTPTPAEAVKLTVDSQQVTEEAELSSAKSEKLKWTLGLFYFHSEDKVDPFELDLLGAYGAAAGLSSVSIADSETTDSIAGFAQATYEFYPDTHLTAGFRYSYEDRSLQAGEVAAVNGLAMTVPLITGYDASVSTEKPTWRISVDHKFSPDILAYASYNRGYKSGGFNLLAPTNSPFKPEILDAFEIGLKTEFADKRIRLNPSIFYYNYSDIQVSEYVSGGEAIYNGAKAELYGLDIDLYAIVTENLTLQGGLELLDSKFTSFPNAVISTALPTGGYSQAPGDATGNQLPYAPTMTATLTANYRLPGEWISPSNGHFDLSVSDAYNSGYYTEPDNHLRQSSFELVNASILWTHPNSKITAKVYVRNIANAVIAQNLATATQTTSRELFAPRTFGATLGVKF